MHIAHSSKVCPDQAKGTPSVYQTPKTSRHYTQLSQRLTMSDGTKIAIDVYLPDTIKQGMQNADHV